MESEVSSGESGRFDDADESSSEHEDYWIATLRLMAVLHPASPLLKSGGLRPSKSTAWVANADDPQTSSDSLVESSEDVGVHDPLRIESAAVALQRDCDAWLKRRCAVLAEMFRRFDQGFPNPAWLRALQEEARHLDRDVDFERRVRKLEAIYGLCLAFGVCGMTPARLRCSKDGLVRAAVREFEAVLCDFQAACIPLRAPGYRIELDRLRDQASQRLMAWIEQRARLMRATSGREEQLASVARARAAVFFRLPPLPSGSSASS